VTRHASEGAPTRVKICGITRERDAMLAVDLGATALGFVFWPASPRYVDPAVARAIVSRLPPLVIAVGVFVNQPLTEMLEHVASVGLGAVQLHGDEPPDVIPRLTRPVIRAVTLDRPDVASVIGGLPDGVVALLDAHDPIRRGGTGNVVNWQRAAEISRRRRLILSGGLTPGNVGEAIGVVRPWAVDVSSGVEVRPGVKDSERLRSFFQAVRASDALGSRGDAPRRPAAGAPGASEEAS
jgi:phosphoribosylanthranilate isomerase